MIRRFLSVFGFRLGWLTASNDGRLLMLWIATAIMLVFSILHGPGEPLLARTINNQVSEFAQMDNRQDLYSTPWWDADKSLAKSSKAAEKTSEKSWRPWVLTGILFVISCIYTPVSKREEATEAIKAAIDYFKAQTETKDSAAEEGKKEGHVSIMEKFSQKVGWKKLLSLDLIGQIAGNFLQRTIFKRIF